jgi:hypothetical protein
MEFSTAQEEEDTMYKRSFKVLLAASVVALGIPVTAAAMPMGDSGGAAAVAVQKSTPVVSEKVAGLYAQAPQPAVTRTPIVSEKTAGLNLSTQPQPVERVVATSSTSFDWGDAGIGAAVTFGLILAVAGAAGMVRRHQGHFAH